MHVTEARPETEARPQEHGRPDATATAAQPTNNQCPWWCDGRTPGHEANDASHYSEAVHVPVVWQLSPGLTTPPTIIVSLYQEDDGDTVAHEPMLEIECGRASRLPADRVPELIAALADQRARLFVDDSEDREPAKRIRFTRHLRGAGRLKVQAIPLRGTARVRIGDEQLLTAEARALAFDILHAAALADIAAALTRLCDEATE